MIWSGMARPGWAGLGEAWHGEARQGEDFGVNQKGN